MAEDDKQPNRRELADELTKSREMNARLLARVEALEATPAAAPSRPAVKLVPYAGLVIATKPCCIGTRRDEGEIFEIEVDALWDDDPYMAVVITEQRPDGKGGIDVITGPNPNAPTPIDFRFRKTVSAAEDPTPRRAAEY